MQFTLLMSSGRYLYSYLLWTFQIAGLCLAINLTYHPKSLAGGTQPRQHIVFDLDWTLIYPTTPDKAELDPKDIIRFENHIYRITPHAVEILTRLQQEGYKISLFSGGSHERNEYVAQQLRAQAKKLGINLDFFKILSFNDLTLKTAPNGAPLRFSDKYAKDLSKINPDTSQVLLVDDISKFSIGEQRNSLLHLFPTYNDSPLPPSQMARRQLKTSAAEAGYEAPNDIEWHKERNKLLWVYDLIKTTQNQPREQFLDIIQKNREKPRCGYILFR